MQQLDKRRSDKEEPHNPRRLGKADLGPYAFEGRMPDRVRDILLRGPNVTKEHRITSNGKLYTTVTVENETRHLVPLIARLLAIDPFVKRAWLCHPLVCHVCYLDGEGGFCAYRNAQMLLNYMCDTGMPGWQKIAKYIKKTRKTQKIHSGIPTILELQNMIERAWDMGFSSEGRTETGGIKATRKYIGTPELVALFQSFNVQFDAHSILDMAALGKNSSTSSPFHQLIQQVLQYFSPVMPEPKETAGPTPSRQSVSSSTSKTRFRVEKESVSHVYQTELPPIYLQLPGHSVTIIGIEESHDGTHSLLVFDPAVKTSQAIRKLLDKEMKKSSRHANQLGPKGRDTRQGSFEPHSPNPTFVGSNKPGSVPLLDAYRRDSTRLGHHKEFELLKLIDR